MGNEQDVPEVILNDGDWNLMAMSETLWDGSCNGNVSGDGCNLYKNHSEARRGGGAVVQMQGASCAEERKI